METNKNSTPDSAITEKVNKNNTARDILILIIIYLLFICLITTKLNNVRLFILFLVLASVAFILIVSYVFIKNNNLFNNIIFIKSKSKESKKILENIDKDRRALNEEAKRNLDLAKQLEELNRYLNDNSKALKLYNEKTNKLNDINKLLANSLINNAAKTKNIVKANRKIGSIASDLINRIKNILRIKSKANHRLGLQGKSRTEIVKGSSMKRFLDKLSKFLGTGKGVSVSREKGLDSGNLDSREQERSESRDINTTDDRTSKTKQQSNEVDTTNTRQQDNKVIERVDNNVQQTIQMPSQIQITDTQQQSQSNRENSLQHNIQTQTQGPQQKQKSELDINAQELKHLMKGKVIDLNNDGTVAGMPIETAKHVAELVSGVKETEQGLESLGIDSGNIEKKLQSYVEDDISQNASQKNGGVDLNRIKDSEREKTKQKELSQEKPASSVADDARQRMLTKREAAKARIKEKQPEVEKPKIEKQSETTLNSFKGTKVNGIESISFDNHVQKLNTSSKEIVSGRNL